LAARQALPEAERAEDHEQQLAALQARITGLQGEVDTAWDQLQGQLADLLNVGLNDLPFSEVTAKAAAMCSDEVALEVRGIAAQGYYREALNRLSQAREPYWAILAKPGLGDDMRVLHDKRTDYNNATAVVGGQGRAEAGGRVVEAVDVGGSSTTTSRQSR